MVGRAGVAGAFGGRLRAGVTVIAIVLASMVGLLDWADRATTGGVATSGSVSQRADPSGVRAAVVPEE